MRRSFLKLISNFTLILFSLNMISSCGDKPGPNMPAGLPSLTWTTGGVTYSADSIDAYYFSNTIIAEKDVNNPANKKHLEILLAGQPGPGFLTGTYMMANGGGNTLAYGEGTNPPNSWPYSVSGTLVITSKSGNIISGNFNTTLNGANGTMNGTFTNISIQ